MSQRMVLTLQAFVVAPGAAGIVGQADVGAAKAALEAMNPQNRLIQPSEVTAAALWLCGPGSEGINGQAITIAGGEL
ncbi:short chain dehydrogenase [mine drainage metagenome]|uniref:Short chain dehydrogenase n=1 Tax=mine drainage metagenome TaxID=410659 RepID=A0A1J5PYM3_9ZZZZ